MRDGKRHRTEGDRHLQIRQARRHPLRGAKGQGLRKELCPRTGVNRLILVEHRLTRRLQIDVEQAAIGIRGGGAHARRRLLWILGGYNTRGLCAHEQNGSSRRRVEIDRSGRRDQSLHDGAILSNSEGKTVENRGELEIRHRGGVSPGRQRGGGKRIDVRAANRPDTLSRRRQICVTCGNAGAESAGGGGDLGDRVNTHGAEGP